MSEYKENLSNKEQSEAFYQRADINHKLIVNMRDISHIMRSLYEGRASQKRILIILNEVKNITQRELTARLGIQPGSASEILSKLENAGLIMRTASETDRRTADISITKQGEQMALEAAIQRDQRHKEMFSILSEREKEELLSLLEKVNEDWNRRYGAEERGLRRRHCGHEGRHERGCGYESRHGRGCGHEGEHRHGRGNEKGHGHRHEYENEHGRDYEKQSEERED